MLVSFGVKQRINARKGINYRKPPSSTVPLNVKRRGAKAFYNYLLFHGMKQPKESTLWEKLIKFLKEVNFKN